MAHPDDAKLELGWDDAAVVLRGERESSDLWRQIVEAFEADFRARRK